VYTVVNTGLVTGTTYEDQTVANGTFYIYYVESVDTKGVSSAPSPALAQQIP
jgi:fibronectin type 3 domain-containing protein